MCRKFLLFLLLEIVLILQNGARADSDSRMFFTKVDSEVHSKSVKLDITFKNNSDHHGLFDLKAEVFEDVGDPITIVIDVFHQYNDEYTSLFKTQPRNLCELFSNPGVEPMVKEYFEALHKHGNIASSCPFKKGHYHLKDYHLDPARVPAGTPEGKYRVDLDIFHDGKLVIRIMWFIVLEKI